MPLYGAILHWIEFKRLFRFEVDLSRRFFFLVLGLWVSGADLIEPDWSELGARLRRGLDPVEESVARFLGLSEEFVLRMEMDRRAFAVAPHQPIYKEQYTYTAHRRFWNALILEDLLYRLPPHRVMRKYSLKRGQTGQVLKAAKLQVSSTANFAHFCGFYLLEDSLAAVAEDLLGPKPDALSRLPSVDPLVRAALKKFDINRLEDVLQPGSRFRIRNVLARLLTPDYFQITSSARTPEKAHKDLKKHCLDLAEGIFQEASALAAEGFV